MIEIDGKLYIIDLDRLMSWVVETPSNEKNISTITTMSYPISNDDEDEVIEKEISETKSTLNDTTNNIRYDLLRNLLNVLFNIYSTDMATIMPMSTKDFSFSQKLIFNTLLDKKIIIEKNNDQ